MISLKVILENRMDMLKGFFLAVCVVALSFGNAFANTVCFNDNFETGNLDKWGGNKDHVVIMPRTDLGGEYWVSVSGSGSEDAITTTNNLIAYSNGTVVTTFIFTSDEPTGNDRSLNAFWRQNPRDTVSPQINLRVVNNAGAAGIGDVQVNNAGVFETILTDVVSFSETNSLSLQINEFGAGFNYDVTVNGHTTNGVTYSQGGTPTDGIGEFLLSDRDVRYAVDNIVIESGPLAAFTDGFETGDFAEWTLLDPNVFTIVSNSAALDGTYSAKVVGDSSGPDEMRATFTALTNGPVVTTFLFTTESAPSGGRNLQAFWREAHGAWPQIWLRVVDGSTGYGSVQVLDNVSAVTILANAVDYSATNSLTLTINGFGDEFSYDVNVNGYTASGLTACQYPGGGNPPLDYLGGIAFANYNAPVILDNIRVTHPGPFTDDFEMGNLDKWGGVTDNFTIGDKDPGALDGNHSISILGNNSATITTAALTSPASRGPVVTTFIFSTDEPPIDRSLNAFWRSNPSGSEGQINLRVGKYAGTAGIGDVQVVNGGAFTTILTDVVQFGGPTNSLRLQINEFGAGFNYDITVNGQTANGVTYWQNGILNGLEEFAFGDRAAEYTVDNILIEIVDRGTMILIQ